MPPSQLVQCPGCSRHAHSTETDCPFCGVQLGAGVPNAPSRSLAFAGSTARLGRLAMATLGIGTLATMTACYGGPPPPAPAHPEPPVTNTSK
jgi:hypothetical protein